MSCIIPFEIFELRKSPFLTGSCKHDEQHNTQRPKINGQSIEVAPLFPGAPAWSRCLLTFRHQDIRQFWRQKDGVYIRQITVRHTAAQQTPQRSFGNIRHSCAAQVTSSLVRNTKSQSETAQAHVPSMIQEDAFQRNTSMTYALLLQMFHGI